MANVSHARANKDFIYLFSGNICKCLGVVRVIGAAQDWFLDGGQIDVEDGVVLCLLVGFHEHRVLKPSFHGRNAPLDGACIAVALRDHPLEHCDVGGQVLNNWLLLQFDAAPGGRALCGGIRELKGLLTLEGVEALNLQNPSGKDVHLVLLGHGEVALLDGLQRDGVHQVTERDPRLHLAAEADEHGLRHVQGHDARGGGEGHRAGAGGEGDADGEARVGVAAGAHRVRQQHAVEPGVDDAVAGAEGHAAAVADEVRQGVVGDHVHGLGVGGGVAEGLHHQVSGESQACEVFELVPRHGPSRVLAAHGRHLRLHVHAREHSGQPRGLGDHLLRQRVAGSLGYLADGGPESGGLGELHRFPRPAREGAADDQGDAAAGAHLVQDHVCLELECREDRLRAVRLDQSLVWKHIDNVPHVELGNVVRYDGQGTGILHGVEKNWRDGAADANAAKLLVGDVRVLIPHQPEHGVCCRFAGGAGANDITHIS
mmetsp:Transcript_17904/g.50905  ORF Transcript_17904/g.50905 Transcript_17904/m.50905 type:complete len:485 (+) Transcript_17904:611-2065(+)